MANNELNYQELFADIEWQSLVPYTPEHEPQSPLYQVAIRLKGDIRLILGLDKGKLQYAPKSDFHQDLAKFIKMARDPQVSKEWVPAVYISAMENLWGKVIAAYSPNLTEEDLLTLSDCIPFQTTPHLLLLLKRYQNEPPADQYTRIYLTISGVDQSQATDPIIEEITALPKPREWPQGKHIPNANEFSVFSDLEYVVPARSELQMKSNLSSGNLSLSVNEEHGGDVFQFIFFYAIR